MKLSKKTREQYSNVILTTIYEEELTDFRNTFLELHPSDQVDVFTSLNQKERHTVYAFLSPKEMARVFSGLKYNNQVQCLEEISMEYASEMFNTMFTDDIVRFLSSIDTKHSNLILKEMDKEKAEKIKSLLAYEKESAGAVMTKELISISSTDTVFEVLNSLRDEAYDAEIVYYLYVVDGDGLLVGVVNLKDLVVTEPDELIQDIMKTRVVFVPDNMNQEDVGKIIKKYNLLAVPVVSNENRLLGIVTVDDVMDIIEVQTTEDFGEISATKGATDVNINSFVAAKKRSPWIITLMFLGLITGGVIDQFEETLEAVVALAIFIPMIMDSAGNVGTQSLAVSVRGLALGTIEEKSYFKMILRELGTGALIGGICMVVIFILISIIYQKTALGLIVGFSIFCTLSASAVIGTTVPLVINKLKFDPAIASGPFITTLNDIIGLLIYFTIATNLINFI